jgi:hypothetical protein
MAEADRTDIVAIPPAEGQRADPLPPVDDPTQPKVGRWYWVREKLNGQGHPAVVEALYPDEDEEGAGVVAPVAGESASRWFACVTHVGSNYVALKSPLNISTRVHIDHFWDWCEFVADPQRVIQENVGQHQGEVHELMAKVREITARLAITTGPVLGPGGSEVRALAVHQGASMDEYKAALVLAKEKTLPALFEGIKQANQLLGKWLSAGILPLQAEADAMAPAISAIQHRVFSVELYAGLVENVEQIADGEPAPSTEKIRIFQRRGYCDEECLAYYEVGGMEFKNLGEFDAWFVKPANLNRLLPYPRCMMAFRVRRYDKARSVVTWMDYIKMMHDREYDMLTFLYIRNGDQVFRLNTSLEFDEKLFPDMDRHKLEGKLYAETYSSGGVSSVITENEWLGMQEDERREKQAAKEKRAKLPKKDHWKVSTVLTKSDRYAPFDRDNLYYDDILKHIQSEVTKHNRLVLILQGLLDRSPVLHPHPPWQLWTEGGFHQALELIYDDSRSLVEGDKPDFEAYRARLNASIERGSVTVGQGETWRKIESRKDRRDRRRGSWNNPGPGGLARVASVQPRLKRVTYEWTRKRALVNYDDADKPDIGCKFSMKVKGVLNVSAYKSGDFMQFFRDPRTRADYAQWAWLLLEAEEYHAGNRKVPDLQTMPLRQKTQDGSFEYRRRKRYLAFVGKAVRLVREITTRGEVTYPKGSLWRVTSLYRGKFSIEGIQADGTEEPGQHRGISGMEPYDFTVEESLPVDPKYVHKPKSRSKSVDDEDDET